MTFDKMEEHDEKQYLNLIQKIINTGTVGKCDELNITEFDNICFYYVIHFTI